MMALRFFLIILSLRFMLLGTTLLITITLPWITCKVPLKRNKFTLLIIIYLFTSDWWLILYLRLDLLYYILRWYYSKFLLTLLLGFYFISIFQLSHDLFAFQFLICKFYTYTLFNFRLNCLSLIMFRLIFHFRSDSIRLKWLIL